MKRARFEGDGTRSIPQNNIFARDIYRAFAGELQSMTTYVQGAMTLARYLPAVTKLFDEIARVEISHYEQLGQLLLHLGVAPALNTRLRQEPIHLGFDATTEASHLARKMMREKIAEEQKSTEEYHRLSANAPARSIANMLSAIAEEEEEHALALRGMLSRFENS